MSSILGFDFGTKSIGIAVGQTITQSATPLTSLKARHGQPNWDQLATIFNEWQPKLCVVGLPLNMDGTEQLVTQQARKFAQRLHGRFGVTIALQDERLTTTEAKARLFEIGGYQRLSKGEVDAVSAVMILEQYMAENTA